ncbi:hypothetical protein [Roseivirga sp.]|uniref:hypothetical protein n=1 Tax=Roseivirga sp. TaxID=1964215 RepID=UPI002B26B4C8|nr:hypothetical protein [Roseivirga sp.]
MKLEGKKENFWHIINSTDFIEIPIDQSVEEEKPPLILRNSKTYYKGYLYVMLTMFAVLNLVLLFNHLFRNKPYEITEFLQVIAFFLIISLVGIIPILDKRPKLTINSMGIETKSQYISWRVVRNMYVRKSPTNYDDRLILIIEKDYKEKEEIELTAIEGTPEELAILIGGYYSTYLKRQDKLN